MDYAAAMRELAQASKNAAAELLAVDGGRKNQALKILAGLLRQERAAIQAENAKDIESAVKSGLSGAKLKRLELSDKVIDCMAEGCEHVATLTDPVGEIEGMARRPNGLLVGRMRVPLGVIAMIYESRPNVTVDSAILCLKAGNAVILRGGSEAIRSNQALAGLIRKALTESGLPAEAVTVVPWTDRAAVKAMLKLDDLIDVVIPRGGEGLIRAVVADATMPVLKHYNGICHIYVDESADLTRAVDIIHNAKVQYPGACNALECLLVHEKVAAALLSAVAERLSASGVSFRACPVALPLLGDKAAPAADSDFGCEFLDLILAVKVVNGQDEAQAHIRRYGSNHTESILTNDHARAMRFLREVDASLVLINASTRFNDGGQLGLGAEIGISTSKLHAYGPMGVKELTSAKFVAFGEGQIRA